MTTKTKTKRKVFKLKTKTFLDSPKSEEPNVLCPKFTDRAFLGYGPKIPTLEAVACHVEDVKAEDTGYCGSISFADGDKGSAQFWFSHYDYSEYHKDSDDDDEEDVYQKVLHLYQVVSGFKDAFERARDAYALAKRVRKA